MSVSGDRSEILVSSTTPDQSFSEIEDLASSSIQSILDDLSSERVGRSEAPLIELNYEETEVNGQNQTVLTVRPYSADTKLTLVGNLPEEAQGVGRKVGGESTSLGIDETIPAEFHSDLYSSIKEPYFLSEDETSFEEGTLEEWDSHGMILYSSEGNYSEMEKARKALIESDMSLDVLNSSGKLEAKYDSGNVILSPLGPETEIDIDSTREEVEIGYAGKTENIQVEIHPTYKSADSRKYDSDLAQNIDQLWEHFTEID